MKGFKLGTKLTLTNLLTLVLFYIITVASFGYLLTTYNELKLKRFSETLTDERKHNLKSIVSIAYSIVENNNDLYIAEKGRTREKLDDYEPKPQTSSAR